MKQKRILFEIITGIKFDPYLAQGMRHVLILLSCLLLSDAFVQAASPTVMLYFPFNGRTGLLRTVRFLRYLMRMRTLLRRLHLTRRFVGMVPLLLMGRSGRRLYPNILRTQNPCLKRLACEVFTKPEPKITQRDGVISTAGEDNNGFKIFLSFDAPEGDGYCKQRHPSCPYNAMQIIKGLMSLRNLQRLQPSSDMQLNELDLMKHHNLL